MAMETIKEEMSNHSNHSVSSREGLSVASDPVVSVDIVDDDDDLLSESSSVFESVGILRNTNLLAPIESFDESDEESDDDSDDDGKAAYIGKGSDEATQETTEVVDISTDDEENKMIEEELTEIDDDDSGDNSDLGERDKKYDLGGTYDLGAPGGVNTYDLGGSGESKYDLGGDSGKNKYDLGTYLDKPSKSAASNPTKVVSLPSVQNSQSTQHRSGSSAYILHKWMTDRDWNAARIYLTSPDLNHKHLQASIFYKNEDGETSLHIACRKRAPRDIVELITNQGGIDSVMAVDTYGGSLPLHHACHFHASLDVIKLLIYIGGADSVKTQDAIGNLPLHWALSKDASFAAVKLLIDTGGWGTVNRVNKLGWNALHAATYFSCNLEVAKLLIDIGGLPIVKRRNKKGQAPIDILYEKNAFDKDSIRLVQDKMGEDKDLLTWLPRQTVDRTMIWIGQQPESVQEKGFFSPFIQVILNEALVDNKFLSILLLDLAAQILLVVALSFCVSMDNWFGYANISFTTLNILIYSTAWCGSRCILQMISTPVRCWISELSNWINGIQTLFVVWSIIILSEDGFDREYQSVIAVIATGIVWFRLVFVLGDLFYCIAVFAAALQRIVANLIAFVVTTSLVVVGLAHMFYTSSKWEEESCLYSNSQSTSTSEANCMNRSLPDSYYTAFTEFLAPGSLFENESYLRAHNYRMVLTFIFAVLIELLLLNVLIAEIVHSLGDAKTGGKKAFWQKRYHFITQLCVAYSAMGKCLRRNKLPEKESSQTEEISNDNIPMSRYAFSAANYEAFPGDFYSFRRWWLKDGNAPIPYARLKYFLSWASWDEILIPGPTFERVLSGCKKDTNSYLARACLYLIFPVILLIQFLCFILGFVSVGYFWPKYMRQALFSGPVDYEGNRDSKVETNVDLMKQEIKSIHNAVKAEKFVVKRMVDDIKTIQTDLKTIASLMKQSGSASVYTEEDGMSEYD